MMMMMMMMMMISLNYYYCPAYSDEPKGFRNGRVSIPKLGEGCRRTSHDTTRAASLGEA
jgi:hypothetical protein